MGSGKSSAAITYMNEHSNDRFIYISPYLDEGKRIKENCPALKFVEPSKKIPEYRFCKTNHTLALLKEGRNIASTHQAFKFYTKEMADVVRDAGYTLIIDEDVDVLDVLPMDIGDLELLERAGYIRQDGEQYQVIDDSYNGKAFRSEFRIMHSRKLIKSDGDSPILYWALPPELMLSFKNVFVLTYLFEGQSISRFFKMYHIGYNAIGTQMCRDGKYRFVAGHSVPPAYTASLSKKIHIFDNPRLNSIGDDKYALSMKWFEKAENARKMKNNLFNYFVNIMGKIPLNVRMWGSFDDARTALSGKGYTTKYVVFNTKAVNEYRDRHVLAYAANLFMNVGQKLYYAEHGVEMNEDLYALSIMVQWVWRSAIRDGKEIWIYIPSRRMRELLIDWIASVEKSYREWDGSTEVVA